MQSRSGSNRAGGAYADEDDKSDYSSSSCSSTNSSKDDAPAASPQKQPLIAKKINNDCIMNLKQKIDIYVA